MVGVCLLGTVRFLDMDCMRAGGIYGGLFAIQADEALLPCVAGFWGAWAPANLKYCITSHIRYQL
jgi:hypothetical protein